MTKKKKSNEERLYTESLEKIPVGVIEEESLPIDVPAVSDPGIMHKKLMNVVGIICIVIGVLGISAAQNSLGAISCGFDTLLGHGTSYACKIVQEKITAYVVLIVIGAVLLIAAYLKN